MIVLFGRVFQFIEKKEGKHPFLRGYLRHSVRLHPLRASVLFFPAPSDPFFFFSTNTPLFLARHPELLHVKAKVSFFPPYGDHSKKPFLGVFSPFKRAQSSSSAPFFSLAPRRAAFF